MLIRLMQRHRFLLRLHWYWVWMARPWWHLVRESRSRLEQKQHFHKLKHWKGKDSCDQARGHPLRFCREFQFAMHQSCDCFNCKP